MPKISALPAASGLNTTDTIPIVQGGTTSRTTVAAITQTATGFLQTGTGATARTPQDKMRETVTPQDFGALGDDFTNDGTALRNTFASFNIYGGRVTLDHCTYHMGASGGNCIPITKPTLVTGVPGVYSALDPSYAASTDDTVNVTPNTAVDHTLCGMHGVSLHSQSTGNRTGRHGIFIDTAAVGSLMMKYTLRDCMIGQGSGTGFYHLNNAVNNPTGSLFGGLFENNSIKGGLRLESSGDSNSIVHNILSGTGYGVFASNAPGASCLEIQANNITASYGSITIRAGSRFRILGNNMEHNTTGAVANNNSAQVDINGADGTMYSGVIKENLISAFSPTDATRLLRIRNCKGTYIADNTFLSGSATVTVGIDIGSDCSDIRVGPNSFNAGVTTKVLDSGVGTMGVVKTATLLNSWVAFAAGTATLKYIKSTDGMVHVWGTIKSGTTTNGTNIASFPLGFRPSETIRAPIQFFNAGTPTSAEITIDTSGNLAINNVTSNVQVNINFTFPALNLADGTSLE